MDMYLSSITGPYIHELKKTIHTIFVQEDFQDKNQILAIVENNINHLFFSTCYLVNFESQHWFNLH